MAVPKVNSCCGCASLKTGTMICGIIGVVLCLLIIIIIYAAPVNPRIFLNVDLKPSTVRIILTISCVISMVLAGLLILGAKTENATVMLPWIGLTIVGVICNVIGAVITFITLLAHGIIGSAIASFAGTCVGTAITVYMWLVVYTYYRELQYEKRNRTPQVYRQP